MIRHFNGETKRILYRAKRNTTSLTDVKIDIWDGDGTKVVDAGTLTELSDGLYYYDYMISSTGNFVYNITCATQPHDMEGSFIVDVSMSSTLADAVWDEELAGHTTSNTTGYRLKRHASSFVKPASQIWSKNEKENLIKTIKAIASEILITKNALQEIESKQKEMFEENVKDIKLSFIEMDKKNKEGSSLLKKELTKLPIINQSIEKQSQNFSAQIREMTQKLQEIEKLGLSNSDKYDTSSFELSQVKNNLTDLQKLVIKSAPTEVLEGFL